MQARDSWEAQHKMFYFGYSGEFFSSLLPAIYLYLYSYYNISSMDASIYK